MKTVLPLAVLGIVFSAAAVVADDGLTPITNLRSGISLVPQGRQGEDWAWERWYHASGDEGAIRWRVDNDYRPPRYVGPVAAPARAYEKPIVFADLAYSDGNPVVGTTGDNGAEWTRERGAPRKWFYGQSDTAGDEWHTLRYWDDDDEWLKRDLPKYPGSQMQSGKCGASDGRFVALVCDIVMKAYGGEKTCVHSFDNQFRSGVRRECDMRNFLLVLCFLHGLRASRNAVDGLVVKVRLVDVVGDHEAFGSHAILKCRS